VGSVLLLFLIAFAALRLNLRPLPDGRVPFRLCKIASSRRPTVDHRCRRNWGQRRTLKQTLTLKQIQVRTPILAQLRQAKPS
jgi:hypothetical protein